MVYVNILWFLFVFRILFEQSALIMLRSVFVTSH